MFNKFKEKDVFITVFKLTFLLYYSDFSLLIYLTYKISILKSNIKRHLSKHLKTLKKNTYKAVIVLALRIISDLKLVNFKESFNLIVISSNLFLLIPFPKFNIKDLFSCSSCSYLYTKYYIKR